MNRQTCSSVAQDHGRDPSQQSYCAASSETHAPLSGPLRTSLSNCIVARHSDVYFGQCGRSSLLVLLVRAKLTEARSSALSKVNTISELWNAPGRPPNTRARQAYMKVYAGTLFKAAFLRTCSHAGRRKEAAAMAALKLRRRQSSPGFVAAAPRWSTNASSSVFARFFPPVWK